VRENACVPVPASPPVARAYPAVQWRRCSNSDKKSRRYGSPYAFGVEPDRECRLADAETGRLFGDYPFGCTDARQAP
jgi:hypothetical protein